MLLDFDTKFNRLDESILHDQHISKNFRQLTQSIDSVSKIADLRKDQQANEIIQHHYLGREIIPGSKLNDSLKSDSKLLNPDSLFLSFNQESMERASRTALEQANSMRDLIQYNKVMLNDPVNYVLRHEIERHRKFTLSFACLIFFFIGAPLGAIIRKGGLGMPIVISVIMFIFYYIIDNTGYKMAREAIWPSFEGMWLSSAILLPIGIFITYKAIVDATLLNPQEYIKIWNIVKYKFYSILKINY
jgi:lipopolysaccharide export system permease protein